MSDFFLRPEAGPIPYWKHHKRAQRALDKIISALHAAVRSTQVSSGDSSGDTNRASRIFFVSGEPGSGKSTLYLTLREMLGESGTKYSEGCERSLGDLRKAVRWLDTLDLEVAGDEGENLLAAVLVRLIEVLLKPDSDSNTVLSNSCEDAIKSLEELTTDIGIAWEGNLRARAGELDPDTFSVEVMRTQRARLGVNERLRKALDELAKNRCYDCDPTTLFVLPVDDFYLKPDASLQLLRLLRMISIPRLFFLVMGDVKTVEALFTEKSLADWTSVAGARTFTAVPRRLNEAQARARELRAHYLRKLLPPGQRAEIEAMDWDEALKFKPEHLGGKEPVVSVSTLGRLLKCNLDSSPESAYRKIKLLEFLVSPFDESTQDSLTAEKTPPPKKDVKNTRSVEEEEKRNKFEKLRKPREAYTALQILDAPSREIMDLWFALQERSEGTEDNSGDVAPSLISVVENSVRFVIEEQNFLNEDEQEILQNVLTTRRYSARDIQFNMDRLSLDLDSSGWTLYSDGDQSDYGLWVRKHRAWKLTVNREVGIDVIRNNSAKSEGVERDAEPYAKLLPPRPTAWIVLLHDLAFTWKPESVTGNLIERLCQELNEQSYAPAAGFHSTLGPPRQKQQLNPLVDLPLWAVWFNGSVYRHFRIPSFKTFRELDRFLYVWSKGIEWLENSDYAKAALEKTISYITSLWALAGRIVLLDAYRDFAEGGGDWYMDFAEGGDDWYREFMDSKGTRFEERFKDFKKKPKRDFNYPASESEEFTKWKERLDDWDAGLTEFETEVLEGTVGRLQARKSTSKQNASKNNQGKRHKAK